MRLLTINQLRLIVEVGVLVRVNLVSLDVIHGNARLLSTNQNLRQLLTKRKQEAFSARTHLHEITLEKKEMMTGK